jgi:hypothetical protein
MRRLSIIQGYCVVHCFPSNNALILGHYHNWASAQLLPHVGPSFNNVPILGHYLTHQKLHINFKGPQNMST